MAEFLVRFQSEPEAPHDLLNPTHSQLLARLLMEMYRDLAVTHFVILGLTENQSPVVTTFYNSAAKQPEIKDLKSLFRTLANVLDDETNVINL